MNYNPPKNPSILYIRGGVWIDRTIDLKPGHNAKPPINYWISGALISVDGL